MSNSDAGEPDVSTDDAAFRAMIDQKFRDAYPHAIEALRRLSRDEDPKVREQARARLVQEHYDPDAD
jgi:hypothetical protein